MNDNLQQLTDAMSRVYPDGHRPQCITPVDSRQSFSGASIYRVETAAGSFALRGWPRDVFPRARICGLHALLEFLFARGVTQVAVPVRTLTGETLWRFGDRDWHLEPWKPGKANYLSDPHPEKLRSAMIALANWHQTAALWHPPRESAEWFAASPAGPSSAIAKRLARFDDRPGFQLEKLRRCVDAATTSPWKEHAQSVLAHFEPLAAVSHADLRRLTPLRFAIHPVLRDVWSDHLLFTVNDVTGLIDPTACRSDNVAVDLARLLGSLLEDDEPRWTEALEAYHRQRPLTGDERELIRVLDRSNVLLSAMTWIDRYFLGRVTIRQPEAPLQRLAMYARRITRLAESANRIFTR